MKYNWDIKVNGVPLIEIRDKLRQAGTAYRFDEFWDEVLPGSESTRSELIELGYLEAMEGRPAWRVSNDGLRLSSASPKRYKRSTAVKKVNDVLNQAAEINANKAAYPYMVANLIVFGSFLDPENEYIGDVDLHVKCVQRHSDPEVQEAAELAVIEAENKRTGSDLGFWGQTVFLNNKTLRALKMRSPIISLVEDFSEAELKEQGIDHVVLVRDGKILITEWRDDGTL